MGLKIKNKTTLEYLSQHIESIIFGTEHPVTFKEIHNCLNEAFETEFKEDDLLEAIETVKERFSDEAYSFEVVQVSGGYQFMSKGVYHNTIGTYLRQSTKKRLSRAAIETLSIIAYKQPVTKPEMERIRGVSCDYSCQKLLEKELITIVGRSDGPGKPLLYGTTLKFMEYFGINSLDDMPKPKDFKEVENTIGEKAPIEEGVEEDKSSPIEVNLEGSDTDTVKIPTAEELEAMIVEVTEEEATEVVNENNGASEESPSDENVETNEEANSENILEETTEEQGEVVTIPIDENQTEVVTEITKGETLDSVIEKNEPTEDTADIENIEDNSEETNEEQDEVVSTPIEENSIELVAEATENEIVDLTIKDNIAVEGTTSTLENTEDVNINNTLEEVEINETMIPNSDSADEFENIELRTEDIDDNGEIKNLAIPIVGSVRTLQDNIDIENTPENIIETEPIAHSEEDEVRMPSSSEPVIDKTQSIVEAFKNKTFEPQIVRKEETILIQTNRIEQTENIDTEVPLSISIDKEDDINVISTTNQSESTDIITPVNSDDLEVIIHDEVLSTPIISDDENTIPTSVVNNEEE